jgi:L-arabinonolactonase
MRETGKAEVAVDCRNTHGEGVVWSAAHGLLMWTDIHGRHLWTLDPATSTSMSYALPERLCCFAPRRDKPWNALLAAFADGFALYDVLTGERRDIAAFERVLSTTRLNDGRTDRMGRMIAGGMDEGSPMAPISSVVVVDRDLSVRTLFGAVACANSICFSPDGSRLYFADSPTGAIDVFHYDAGDGTVSSRQVLAQTSGVPDGSCVDAEGYLWNAVWEGYRVERYAPDGRLDRVVELPVAKPTCCEFGGADLRTLYITTSRLGTPDDQLSREPLSGSLFAYRADVAGLPAVPFG